MRSLLPRLAGALGVLLAAAACGDGGPPADAGGPDLPFGGVSTVVGSDVEAWSLLAVPREGGRVEARAVGDPSRVVWTGETRLPPSAEIHLLGPRLVIRTPEGAVHRYDPRSDQLVRVGEIGSDARWAAQGRQGVFADPDGRLLQVGPDSAWRYEIDGRPVWAEPAADGGVAVLVERDGAPAALWLLQRGESEPAARTDSSFRAPALVTAWGERLAAVGGGGGTLRFLAVPSLNTTGSVPLPSQPGALAASPSSHEIYVGVAPPPRLLRVSRFALESEVLAETAGRARAIRPATLGSFLLVDDGGQPLWVPLDGGDPRRLRGRWRADLPLGTPDGRVLLAREDGLAVWDPGGGGARPVDAPADRWWGAVRWNPAPPAVVSGRVDGDRVAAADTDTVAAAGRRRARDPRAGRPPPDSLVPAEVPEAGAGDGEGAADSTPPPGAGGLAPGYYAVVTAARDADGVRRLVDRLSAAGFPTAVQRHRDDAGRLWFRGMVGPYGSREEAEAAARQLRRERDVDPWVTEVRAAGDARDIFP